MCNRSGKKEGMKRMRLAKKQVERAEKVKAEKDMKTKWPRDDRDNGEKEVKIG